jgi:hypothetical protein
VGVLTRSSALAAGALPGAALGAAAFVAGLVRRDKALHPIGHQGAGTLVVTDPMPGLGIEALAAGSRPCVVRWSRSMGLPEGWPDIEGIALRLPDGGRDGDAADILFASTGSFPGARFMLTLRGPGSFGRLTSLLPVRAAGRAVTFMLVPDVEAIDDLPPAAYTLHVALGVGAWHHVARIDLEWSVTDSVVRFDPVTNQLAGIEQYPFVAALREPSYAAARSVTRAGRAARQRRAAARRGERPARAGIP